MAENEGIKFCCWEFETESSLVLLFDGGDWFEVLVLLAAGFLEGANFIVVCVVGPALPFTILFSLFSWAFKAFSFCF